MGMAASQARYIELTARKNNVEYEGQQINQQRTNLANESSGMFTQLMALKVPTPPSTGDFTTTTYSFNDGVNGCTIAQGGIHTITGDPDYNAEVTYSYPETNYTGMDKIRTDLGVDKVGSTYWLTNGANPPVNKTKLTQCQETDDNYAKEKAAVEEIIADTSTAAKPTQFELDYYSNPAKPDGDISKIYTYTNASGSTFYLSSTDIATLAGKSGAAGTLNNYYATNITSQQTQTELAYVTMSDSGRYNTIKLQSDSNTLDLTATTATDQNAYEDAMNEYEYQQSLYQQQITSINAKTSIIQVEDRTLEMKLKQLDTEQEALSTEMESVKKVIDKNIEQTFKTFQ